LTSLLTDQFAKLLSFEEKISQLSLQRLKSSGRNHTYVFEIYANINFPRFWNNNCYKFWPDKQKTSSQGGSKQILNYVGNPISASLFFRPVNLSTPANFVGNTDFNRVLAACRAKISGTAAIHKNGLTAGDYLANPVISKSAVSGDFSQKSSPAASKADTDPERTASIKMTNADVDAFCKKSEWEPTIKPITRDQPNDLSSPSKAVRIYESDVVERSIQKAAKKYNLPPALIKAVIKAESNFDTNAVSSAGAQGLMQLMPATARELGVNNSFDIDQNIDGGSHYLRKMLDKFGGNTKLALAAYNAGPGAVEKFKGNVPYPETRNYIKRVMRFSAWYT
jgi:hypothetical protein